QRFGMAFFLCRHVSARNIQENARFAYGSRFAIANPHGIGFSQSSFAVWAGTVKPVQRALFLFPHCPWCFAYFHPLGRGVPSFCPSQRLKPLSADANPEIPLMERQLLEVTLQVPDRAGCVCRDQTIALHSLSASPSAVIIPE